ncbi:MAG: GNAT family N-acetyltransferase [Anaerolineaceae bacterium]|nr:GNAT family N-acetyltransferase [Anaerolineaceae bacterium]MCB9097952.1 GNAT family N-acetyltransferase [Anaerolineales bacterium]
MLENSINGDLHPICLHDRAEIEAYLRRTAPLHLYELGDLDDFFWPYTTWYAHRPAGDIDQVALIYSGISLPVLLALTPPPFEAMAALLRSIRPFLPKRIYAHLSSNLVEVLAGDYQIESHGPHHKMILANPAALAAVETSQVIPLAATDLDRLNALYQASYPDNAFDARMLETGCFFGLEDDGALVSVAGIHVYSEQYRVAALGNVTTHPAQRGRGMALAVCARLGQQLLERGIEHIGLNVKADNQAAIACYQKLGFEYVATYTEYMLTA